MFAYLRYYLGYLRACFRLLFNNCPECNSDAPRLYTCPVCQFYSGKYPPPAKLMNKWLERWKRLHSPSRKD
jgi:hypothetical protein